MGRFKEEIEEYDAKFAQLYQFLERLNQIQRKWVYLEAIFMRGALPEQQGRYRIAWPKMPECWSYVRWLASRRFLTASWINWSVARRP